ncbi:MAG: TolC family protein [Acidobacteriaceae bacterium]|nr:TolC family protein [Acidobacteriaceae bacterium]MBV9782051.1 TolC family protein [Acidobacteriaceae bacterium]
MKKRNPFTTFVSVRRRARFLIIIFSAPACAFGQLGGPPAPSQGTLANQLSLSGRTAQSGSVNATQTPVPGTTASVNTLNASVQSSGAFAGSVISLAKLPFSGKLSFREAIERGVVYNLGAVGMATALRQSQGQARVVRSALLPNLSATLSETELQNNLAIAGIHFQSPIPGFSIPTIVGPFNYFDLRARLTQTVADFAAWKNYRSAEEITRANVLAMKDARDMVVLAVGGAYLEVIAAKGRVESERAQIETANALFQQTSQQRAVGLVAQTDVNRSRVQLLTQQERLATLQNDLSKQKINLARLTGLPANDQFEITDEIPLSPMPEMSVEDALRQAYSQRTDLKAAEAQVRAATLTRSAARAERLPSLSLSADYGVNGLRPDQSHGTFNVTGTLTVPIWRGGRTEGDIEEADAAVSQRMAELEDLRSKIESDIRSAYLDLQAANNQVNVATENLKVTKETLDLTRQRFEAGVSDNVAVVQAQESVASAELDYVNSVFAHNVAKLSLARAMGEASDKLFQFLRMP